MPLARIFIVSGPGGAGKSTLVARLVEGDPTLWLSRSWTTRKQRPSETERDYYFVDRQTFEAHRLAGGFLETDEFLGNLYGTPNPTPPPGKDVVLEINVAGAEQVKATRPDAVTILVVAPSPEVQAARLRIRGDDDEHVARRLEIAAGEEERGRRIADHVVINDELDRAVTEVVGILCAYRTAPSAD